MTGPRIRDDLQALTGYHSAQVDAEVRLNTNESPFEPPREFLEALASAVSSSHLNRYPDRTANSLRKAIAAKHGASPAEIFCGNGSNEVLQSLLLAFGGAERSALVFEPTYPLHSHIARICATDVIAVSRSADFDLTANQVGAAVRASDPAITFLCSPNNPTGLSVTPDVVAAALEAGTGLVVVDEAYGQFAVHSALDQRDGFGSDRLVIVRTFSKTWGLAGIRLGYCVAEPSIIDGLYAASLPYNLSALTQRAGELALGFEDAMLTGVAEVIAERDRVLDALGEMPVKVWPTDANFILFRPLTVEGSAVWKALVERSILIRDCSAWSSLEGCLRVTVGTSAENDRFINALKEIL